MTKKVKESNEKEARPVYEAPQAMKIQEAQAGHGICQTGSGETGTCNTGNMASSDCAANGNTPGTICDSTGNTVV